MKFIVRATSAMGTVGYPPADAAVALRTVIDLKKRGFSAIFLVVAETGAELDIEQFIRDAGPPA